MVVYRSRRSVVFTMICSICCCCMLSLICIFIAFILHLQYKPLDGGVPVKKRGCIEYYLYYRLLLYAFVVFYFHCIYIAFAT